MNYYKPMHQQSPEQIVSRSNQIFLRIIALYVLITVCGFAIDMKFYHLTDTRIYYLVENKKELDSRITANLRYYGKSTVYIGQFRQYPPQTNSDICRTLKLEIVRNGQDELTVRVWDDSRSRFELPEKDINRKL